MYKYIQFDCNKKYAQAFDNKMTKSGWKFVRNMRVMQDNFVFSVLNKYFARKKSPYDYAKKSIE